jgi:hypothetical protein
MQSGREEGGSRHPREVHRRAQAQGILGGCGAGDWHGGGSAGSGASCGRVLAAIVDLPTGE